MVEEHHGEKPGERKLKKKAGTTDDADDEWEAQHSGLGYWPRFRWRNQSGINHPVNIPDRVLVPGTWVLTQELDELECRVANILLGCCTFSA